MFYAVVLMALGLHFDNELTYGAGFGILIIEVLRNILGDYIEITYTDHG